MADILGGREANYIKMDIEGAEPGAVEDCGRLLREDRPVLVACVHHAQDYFDHG